MLSFGRFCEGNQNLGNGFGKVCRLAVCHETVLWFSATFRLHDSSSRSNVSRGRELHDAPNLQTVKKSAIWPHEILCSQDAIASIACSTVESSNMAFPENSSTVRDRSVKSSMFAVCFASFGLVTWALISPDPFAAVKRTPFSFLSTVSDLCLHFAAFSVCAAMCGCLVPASGDSLKRKITVIGLIAYAVGTELIQQSIPRRTCDPMDAIANLCGIAAGLYVASLVTRQIAAFGR